MESKNSTINPISLSRRQLVDKLVEVLDQDDKVAFAYLYGSIASEGSGHDVDVAVHPKSKVDDTSVSMDLRIELHKKLGISPELLDVRNIAGIIEKGDVLALVFLRNVLENGVLLVNKENAVHADFLERYGRKFRECEGFMEALLT